MKEGGQATLRLVVLPIAHASGMSMLRIVYIAHALGGKDRKQLESIHGGHAIAQAASLKLMLGTWAK